MITHRDAGHGERRAKEYRAWLGMRKRCLNPNDPAYCNYGGRGITVCAEWINDYPAFLAHIGRAPSAQHSVDRIDNDQGYAPGNVRWATAQQQRVNRRIKQYCKRGHPLSGDNVVGTAHRCRTCMTEYDRERYKELRAVGAYIYRRGPKLPETHCKRGHEFTPENTIYLPRYATRRCRTCVNENKKRYYYNKSRQAEFKKKLQEA